MDLIGLNPDGTVQFSLTPVPANKMELFILSTSPYMHPRLDSRIEPKFSDWWIPMKRIDLLQNVL